MVEAVLKARNIGRVLAGIEALLLAFVCWYRIHAGAAWIAVTKDWFAGIFICAYVLTAAGTPAGLERWLWDVGVYLGRQFTPGQGFLMENFDKAVGRHGELMLALQKLIPMLGDDERRLVEAIAWQFSSPTVAGLVGVNAIAIYLMKMVMQVSYAWLISFYWMLTPMVAPMVILPQTRQLLGHGHELVPGRVHAAHLQHHVLLRVPVDPGGQLPDRVGSVQAVPHAVDHEAKELHLFPLIWRG